MDGETLYETSERYNTLLQIGLQHNLSVHQEVKTCYNGINVCARQLSRAAYKEKHATRKEINEDQKNHVNGILFKITVSEGNQMAK